MIKVFIVPVHVRPMSHSIMPANFSGAYVSCYAPGRDYEDAARRILTKLREDGLSVKEILEPVYEMDSGSWCQHISETWPEQAGSMSNQDDFDEIMKNNGVVYGPFGSYESSSRDFIAQ